MTKLFSVIIAVFNREALIRFAIDSVLRQTFQDYELIVVDDGSTDHTLDTLYSYGDRIKVIRQKNQGPDVAYRTGVSHAAGEYLAFLDSDDGFFPYTLATYDKVIRTLDSPPLIIGSGQRTSGNLGSQLDGSAIQPVKVLKYRDYLSKDVRIATSQSKVVMQKSLYSAVYGPRWRINPGYLNDYHLILQAGIFGPCIIIDQPASIFYRVHEGNASKNAVKCGTALLPLLQAVKSGQCSGGYSRLFDKYAFLGGPVSEWSRKALKIRQWRLAFKIIAQGWPAVICNQIKKFSCLFHGSAIPIDIADDKNAHFSMAQ